MLIFTVYKRQSGKGRKQGKLRRGIKSNTWKRQVQGNKEFCRSGVIEDEEKVIRVIMVKILNIICNISRK